MFPNLGTPLSESGVKGMVSAYFFDRDGTLNEDNGYVHRWDQFRWRPGAIAAIKELNSSGILVVVITNQGGIAHGYYTEAEMQALHQRMNADLARHRAGIDAFYHCPHHPRGTVPRFSISCSCRKPQPGMLLQAIAEHGIDVRSSVLIGDKESDLQAGSTAGICSLKMVDRGQDLYSLVSYLVRRPRSGFRHNQFQPAE